MRHLTARSSARFERRSAPALPPWHRGRTLPGTLTPAGPVITFTHRGAQVDPRTGPAIIPPMTEPKWYKSTFSNGEGDCVEVAESPASGNILVRDSKNPEGSRLVFTVSEWRAFIAGAQNGQFDL